MKTVGTLLLIGVFSLATLSTYATNGGSRIARLSGSGTTNIVGTGSQKSTSWVGSGMLTATGQTIKNNIKNLKIQAKQSIETNKAEITKNFTDFHAQFGTASGAFAELSSETQVQLKKLLSDSKAQTKSLVNEYKTKTGNATTMAERQNIENEYIEKVNTIENNFYTQTLVLVGNDVTAKAWVQARHNLYLKNNSLREANRDTRWDARTEKSIQLQTQGALDIEKITNQVNKIGQKNPNALSKILTKIQTLEKKYETSTALTPEAKVSILSQLKELEKIVQDKINASK